MWIKTRTFKAAGDDGREYVIEEHTEFVDVKNVTDPTAKIPGMRKFVTANGEAVNKLQNQPGKYRIVSTSVTLQSDEPQLPI